MKKTRINFFSGTFLLALYLIFILTNSCQNEGIPADQFEQICFTEQVLPIFQNSCSTTGCHDNGGVGGYMFTDYINIMKAVIPGDADKSKAYQAITSTFQLMPPGNPLPEGKRAIIRLWIEQGALETSCNSPKYAGTN